MAGVRVNCRCGTRHELRARTVDCRRCGTPTFDHHRTCARCRGTEDPSALYTDPDQLALVLT